MATLKIGKIEVEDGILLAPMEGITDLPFRIICRRLGADIVYSEFISSEALIRDSRKSFEKMDIIDEERPVAVQIFGHNIESMVESAKIVAESDVDIIDINAGCPVKKVVKKGAGAGLMQTPEYMVEMAHEVSQAVSLPVTLKTRLGWDSSHINIIEIAEMLDKTGIEALTVHCRTREMMMRGNADWKLMPEIRKAFSKPLILNGDIKTPYDAKRAFETTECDAIMIGRAAVGNPFLFKKVKDYLKEGLNPEETNVKESIDTCIQHLDLSVKYKGFPRGLFEFRKHYSGYLKGLYNASSIRQKLVLMDSMDEIKKTLWDYHDYLLKEGRDTPFSKLTYKSDSNLTIGREKDDLVF